MNGGRSEALKRVQECFKREFVRENKINPYTFSHTYAHSMLDWGVPKEVLQTLLGHLSIKIPTSMPTGSAKRSLKSGSEFYMVQLTFYFVT